MMGFLNPLGLLVLLVLPLMVAAYRVGVNDRRARAAAAVHPDLALLARAGSGRRPFKRHLPALLYLLAVGLAGFAVARPTAPLPVPDNRTTIMLSIDVSLSMRAEDIPPNRFEAAKDAARTFVRALPSGAKVGLASFAGYAVLDVEPTSEHERVLEAIERLELGRGTAIGAGLETALQGLPGRGENDPKGERPPAVVVLLSDGRENRDTDPLGAAAKAREASVKVYTVGLGTEQGFLPYSESMGIGGFLVGFDAETLKAIAQTTGGRYYEARSASALRSIYGGLGRSIGWTTKPGEVSSVFAAMAGLVLLGSLAASELTRRVV